MHTYYVMNKGKKTYCEWHFIPYFPGHEFWMHIFLVNELNAHTPCSPHAWNLGDKVVGSAWLNTIIFILDTCLFFFYITIVNANYKSLSSSGDDPLVGFRKPLFLFSLCARVNKIYITLLALHFFCLPCSFFLSYSTGVHFYLFFHLPIFQAASLIAQLATASGS